MQANIISPSGLFGMQEGTIKMSINNWLCPGEHNIALATRKHLSDAIEIALIRKTKLNIVRYFLA